MADLPFLEVLQLETNRLNIANWITCAQFATDKSAANANRRACYLFACVLAVFMWSWKLVST